MDLMRAYTLLSCRPEDIGLFGMEVTGDVVYLQIVGIFGWACTPAAFQVVTRAGILWEREYYSFKRSNNAEVCLGGSAVDLGFLEFQEDSSFQNLSEFLGIILWSR